VGTEFTALRYGDSLNFAVGCTDGSAPAACTGDFEEILRGGGAAMFQDLGRRRTWDGWRKGLERAQTYDLGLGTFYGGSLVGLHEQEHVLRMYEGPLSAQALLDAGYKFADGVPQRLSLLAFAPQNSTSGGQPLSPCLQNALRQFFPKMSVQGKDYSPIDDARFKSGIPLWIRVGSHLPTAVTPGAITLGLYDIHYDPNSLNLNGGTSEDLKTILEEVSHTKQFLDEWAGMKQRAIIQPSVDYYHAMDAWENKYTRAVLKGGSGYNNELEKWAKNNANKILQQLEAVS
jgi:hypothetical protein